MQVEEGLLFLLCLTFEGKTIPEVRRRKKGEGMIFEKLTNIFYSWTCKANKSINKNTVIFFFFLLFSSQKKEEVSIKVKTHTQTHAKRMRDDCSLINTQVLLWTFLIEKINSVCNKKLFEIYQRNLITSIFIFSFFFYYTIDNGVITFFCFLFIYLLLFFLSTCLHFFCSRKFFLLLHFLSEVGEGLSFSFPFT